MTLSHAKRVQTCSNVAKEKGYCQYNCQYLALDPCIWIYFENGKVLIRIKCGDATPTHIAYGSIELISIRIFLKINAYKIKFYTHFLEKRPRYTRFRKNAYRIQFYTPVFRIPYAICVGVASP